MLEDLRNKIQNFNHDEYLTFAELQERMKKYKKEKPIKYFFSESFVDFVYFTFIRPIKRVYYYLKNKYVKKYHILKLTDKAGWLDADYKIELALEKILIDFIEKEKPFEIVDYGSDEEHKNAATKIKTSYYWVKVERPKLLIEIQKLEEQLLNKQELNINKLLNHTWTKEEKELNKKLHLLEAKVFNRNTEMYKDLIEIRQFLWT